MILTAFLQLDPTELAIRTRPSRFWYGPALSQLTLMRLRSDRTLRRGDRVYLKDHSSAPVTRHGEGDPNGAIEVRALVVQDVRTSVDVLWQDGTMERNVPSTALVPYLNPGDTDAWYSRGHASSHCVAHAVS
jgi:ubiquitin-conjugating enzyme E2 O